MNRLNGIYQRGKNIANSLNIKEKLQIAAVQKEPFSIMNIQNPSEQVQHAAVQRNGTALEYIQKPSEAVQLMAVQQNPDAILHIENPSEEVQLAAIQQNGNYIQTISNPSERVQLAAVNQHGYFIEAIDNPSERVQMVAIKEDLGNITLINSPCEAAQIYAVKHDPFVVSLIPTTEAVRILAVEQKPSVILHIENPSETLCKLAIEKEFPGAVIIFSNPETTKKLFARLENINTQEERIQMFETLKNEYLVNTQARIEAIQVLQGNAPEQVLEERFEHLRSQFPYEELGFNEAINDGETGITYREPRMMSDNHQAKINIQRSAQYFASEIKNALSPVESLIFAKEIESVSNLPLGRIPTTEETLSLFSNQFNQEEFTSSVFENEKIGQYQFQSPIIQYEQKGSELLHAGTHPYSPNYKEVFSKAGLKEEFNNFEKACCARSQWNDAYNYGIVAHDIAEIGDLERKLPTLDERVENCRDLVYNKLSIISETNNRLQAGSDIIQEPKKLSSDFQNLGRGKSENDLAVQVNRLYNQAGSNELRKARILQAHNNVRSNLRTYGFGSELGDSYRISSSEQRQKPKKQLVEEKQIPQETLQSITTALSEYKESAQNLINELTTKLPTATAIEIPKINSMVSALSNPKTAFAIGEKANQYVSIFKELGVEQQFTDFREKWERLNQLCELSSDTNTAKLTVEEKRLLLKEYVKADDAFESATMELINNIKDKEKVLTPGIESSVSNKSSLNDAQNIHSLKAVSANYKSLGYDSVTESINKYAPNYTSIVESGSSLNYKIENVEIQSAGAKKLYGDIVISKADGKTTAALENLCIKDKSTGLTEPFRTNGIDISKQPADTVKKLLSGSQVKTSSLGITQVLGLNKTPLGWGISIGKQIFNSADSSAGIG